MSEEKIEEMASAIEELEPVEISLSVTLDESDIVKFYQLKDEFPIEILKDAWGAAVKDQIDNQYDNKDQIRQQLIQQGIIDEDEGVEDSE